MGSSSSKQKEEKPKAKPVVISKGIKKGTAEQQKQLRMVKGLKKQIISGKPIEFFGGSKHSDYFDDEIVQRADGLLELKKKK